MSMLTRQLDGLLPCAPSCSDLVVPTTFSTFSERSRTADVQLLSEACSILRPDSTQRREQASLQRSCRSKLYSTMPDLSNTWNVKTESWSSFGFPGSL